MSEHTFMNDLQGMIEQRAEQRAAEIIMEVAQEIINRTGKKQPEVKEQKELDLKSGKSKKKKRKGIKPEIKIARKKEGAALGVLLDNLGVTHKEAAEMMGIDSWYVSHYCRGESIKPEVKKVLREFRESYE